MNGNWEQNKINKVSNFIFKNIWPILISFLFSLPVVFCSIIIPFEILKILIFAFLGPVIYGLKKYYYKMSDDTELIDFFNAVKKFFLRGFIVSLIYLLLVCLFLFNINYYSQMNIYYVSNLFVVLTFISLLFYIYFLMIDVHFSFRMLDIFRLIIYYLFSFIRNTISTVLLLFIMLYMIVKIPDTMMFLVVFLIFVFIFYINKNIIFDIQNKFIKEK
ncbi:hypothetical protein HMPREF2811_01790 [Globicatella sp. HMSC072A10]|uniref:hypothetical protein n=1 Tax=Globicatella sp. HMSC072A10 TaxID=1739315 RepID=UPI0008BAA8AC|nr:hypothetical protein [Globicatella sp. HMSC072A10]OFK56510.1 hypothetical protein HMPREF2811_01790 [Globicatella sp. HMSC072A10]